jgi:hypothetical protein
MNYVAEGYNSFDTKKAPSGVVRYLPDPKSVLALIQNGKLKEHILLVQGGTTTFLAPESHLGILSREFQMPCVMTVYLVGSDSRYATGANNDAHFAAIINALNGKKVQLHCEDRETGRVALLD